jgi:hypothetical protein
MSHADDHPGYRIDTEDQARNWILELVDGVKEARLQCDIMFPGDQAATVRHQKKSYAAFMVKHGSALGALMSLHRVGKISDVCYSELRKIVIDTLIPTVVGVTGDISRIR